MVDQPATIGALPVAVAQAAIVTVGYPPGLAMHRIADLQTVTVIGTNAHDGAAPARPDARRHPRHRLHAVDALVEAHPLHPVLTSLPAVGVRTATRILTEIVGKDFAPQGT